MATGQFWNVGTTKPLKPWGLFDPNADLIFPITITEWLADMASSYASHQVITTSPLEHVSSAHSAGIIQIRMKLATAAVYEDGAKYPFTLRLVCADGQQDDRTFYLKIKEH